MSAEITNAVTGEAMIADDERGTAVHVVFTLEAVARLEAMPGVPAILDLIGNARFSLTQTVQIIAAGSEAFRRRNPGSQNQLNEKRIFRLIEGAGGLPVLNPVLLESLIKAEGLGLRDEFDDDDDDDEDDDGLEVVLGDGEDAAAPLDEPSERPRKQGSRPRQPGPTRT